MATFYAALALYAIMDRIEPIALAYFMAIFVGLVCGIVAGLTWWALMRRWWQHEDADR